MSADDIIDAIIDGYAVSSGLRKLISDVKSFIKDEGPRVKPSTEEIFKVVSKHHRLPVNHTSSKLRNSNLVKVRQQYCLLAALFKYSQSDIGKEINRDHSTAYYGKKIALMFCTTEIEYMDEIKQLINKFPRYRASLFNRLEVLIEKYNYNYGKATK